MSPKLDLLVGNFRWYIEKNDIEARSMFGSQSIEIGEPVWRVSFQTIYARNSIASSVESLLDELNGKQNQLALYHIALPAPLGTLRGTNTLASSAVKGATTVTINCSSPNGSTLLKGDLVGFGTGYNQQVVRVITNATSAAGQMTFSFYPKLRNALSSGTAMIWDKPRALFRQETMSTGANYMPGLAAEGIAVELREDWRV